MGCTGGGQSLLMGSGHALSIRLAPQHGGILLANGHRHLLQTTLGGDDVGFAYVPDDDDDSHRHHRHWTAHPEQSMQASNPFSQASNKVTRGKAMHSASRWVLCMKRSSLLL